MKTYADTTLKRMTKDELIEAIRCLEHNVSAVEEMNANQFKILMERDLHTCANCGNNYNRTVNHGKIGVRCDFMDAALTENDYCSKWRE